MKKRFHLIKRKKNNRIYIYDTWYNYLLDLYFLSHKVASDTRDNFERLSETDDIKYTFHNGHLIFINP